MIELGRRGFITGLVALVAAPAVIRVAPLMPISSRFTPLYVPIDWLSLKYGMEPLALRAQNLKAHAWPRPLGDTWIDINNYDPEYVKQWPEPVGWGRGQHWWGNDVYEET